MSNRYIPPESAKRKNYVLNKYPFVLTVETQPLFIVFEIELKINFIDI